MSYLDDHKSGWVDFLGYNYRKHRLFTHEEGYAVCPECGELLMDYLPEDDEERAALVEAYNSRYSFVNRGDKARLLFIIPVIILFLITFNIDDHYHGFGPGNRFPVGGPYIEVYHCFMLTYYLALKGLEQLMKLIFPDSNLRLGEGGSAFTRYWQWRFLWVGLVLIVCLCNLPHYPDLFGRQLIDSDPFPNPLEEFRQFIWVCRLAYLPSFVAFVIYEIYQYKRYSFILYLNGRE